MGLIKTIRASDSPYLKAVTVYRCDGDAKDLAVPDESWDIVVMRHEGRVQVLLTGQTTKAVPLSFVPGDEFLTLSFQPHAFLNTVSAEMLLDEGRLLPTADHTFRLGADTLEIPTFDNAEGLAERLARHSLLSCDSVVEGLLTGRPLAMSLRSVQRHFQRTTGMSANAFAQIRRAHRTALLLSQGRHAVDAALEMGYSDQPHMIRSLHRILGRTPTELLSSSPL